MSAPRQRHRYDHRLRKLVYDSQEIGIALSLGVPKSTANGWLRHEPPPVITLDVFDMGSERMRRA